MNNLYSFFMLMFFALGYASLSHSEFDQQVINSIAEKIVKGEKLEPEQAKQFDEIIQFWQEEASEYCKEAIKQIKQKGIISKSPNPKTKLINYRKEFAGQFRKIDYERKQKLTELVANLIEELKLLEDTQFEKDEFLAWTTETQSPVEQLLSKAREKLDNFSQSHQTFSFLKSPDAQEALRLSLEYGIVPFVSYFVLNNEWLTEQQLGQCIDDLNNFQNVSVEQDLAWFYMQDSNFEECRKIIRAHIDSRKL